MKTINIAIFTAFLLIAGYGIAAGQEVQEPEKPAEKHGVVVTKGVVEYLPPGEEVPTAKKEEAENQLATLFDDLAKEVKESAASITPGTNYSITVGLQVKPKSRLVAVTITPKAERVYYNFTERYQAKNPTDGKPHEGEKPYAEYISCLAKKILSFIK